MVHVARSSPGQRGSGRSPDGETRPEPELRARRAALKRTRGRIAERAIRSKLSMTSADWMGLAAVAVLILLAAILAAAEVVITRTSRVHAYRLHAEESTWRAWEARSQS
jgi:hypothetical protein